METDELVGYHLEQAVRYCEDLGESRPDLALRAGERLVAAGRRAYWRGDLAAALSLIERSLELTRPHRFDVHLEVVLAEVLPGTDIARAIAVADAAAQRAASAGDQAGAALARTVAAELRGNTGQITAQEAERLGREALPLLEAAGDDDGLASVWEAIGSVANLRCRMEDWARASEQALRHAPPAARGVHRAVLIRALVLGPRPASEVLATLQALTPEQQHPVALLARAVLLAMLDRIEEAWRLALSLSERGGEFGFTFAETALADIALMEGDWERAAAYLQRACDRLEATGRTTQLSTYAPASRQRPLHARPLRRGRAAGPDRPQPLLLQKTC